jgi:hypothetical protein
MHYIITKLASRSNANVKKDGCVDTDQSADIDLNYSEL